MLEFFSPQVFDVINISDAIFPSQILLYFVVMRGCITCDLYLPGFHNLFISVRARSEWQMPALKMEEPFQHPKQNSYFR